MKRLVNLLLFVPICLGGLQVPLLIINFSPWPATVNLKYEPQCMKGAFNPSSLEHYYQSWASTSTALRSKYSEKELPQDMINYLATYKALFGIDNLGSRRYSLYGGVVTLPAAEFNQSTPFGVFETEVSGNTDCWAHDAWKYFSISAGPTTTQLKLYDPWDDHWQIVKDPLTNPFVIDIGPGGKADPVRVAIDVVIGTVTIALTFVGLTKLGFAARTFAVYLAADATYAATIAPGLKALTLLGGMALIGAGSSLTAMIILPGIGANSGSTPTNITPRLLAFDDVYKDVALDSRNACLMGENIMGHFDCRIASTSLVIQADGSVFAVPMPPIHRGWD